MMITNKNLLNLPIFQSAWVVDDIETACLEWSKKLGIGPFFVNQYGPNEITNTTYRGEPGRFEIIVALAQAGQTQIELIQPLISPSIYRDAVKSGQPGFHHVGAWSYDIESDIERFQELNFPTVTTGAAGETRFAYFDTRPIIGCMFELVTASQEIDAFFASITDACSNWDGNNPIRYS